MIVFAAIMPHPLESMPGIGTPGEFFAIKKTLKAFKILRKELESVDPQTIIIISPHAQLEAYAFVINSEPSLRGSLEKFGLNEVYQYHNNIEIADKISFACLMNEDLQPLLRADFLDHGALIPLYHLTKNYPPDAKPKIVHLAFSLMSYERHYRYGELIQKIADSQDVGRVAIIASGDLSHCLTQNAPAGFVASAREFDHEVLRYLGGNDLASLMGLEDEKTQEMRECGIRSVIILLGILHGKKHDFRLLSYEGPFGVGYLTARLL